jgi:hypothetical protein
MCTKRGEADGVALGALKGRLETFGLLALLAHVAVGFGEDQALDGLGAAFFGVSTGLIGTRRILPDLGAARYERRTASRPRVQVRVTPTKAAPKGREPGPHAAGGELELPAPECLATREVAAVS